jgi:6-phosphogluconolactonase
MTRDIRIFDDPTSLAAAVAADFIPVVSSPPSASVHDIALTGGTIAVKVHEAIAALAAESAVDWSRVQFWFGDERFVPRDSPDRNALQAREAMLDSLPDAIIREIPSSDDVATAQESADAYAELVRSEGTGGFTIAMFGLGRNGHVASLFPGHDTLHVTDAIAVAELNSPKPPPERVSLTFEALNRQTGQQWFLVAGVEKAEAVARALAADGSIEETPARGLTCPHQTWYLDSAAASRLT